MMITQLHGITPEELVQLVLNGIERQINALKEDYQPKEPPKYLTRKQTAERLSISLVCLHDWTNKGILKSYKLGNRTYYRQEDIESALLNSNRK